MGRVEVQLTESFAAIRNGQPSMRHKRCFSNTSSDKLLSALLGLKFCGAGGLMIDSTADSEEGSPDRGSRIIRNFRPLGNSFASAFTGSFHVHQEILECSTTPQGIAALIRMSFSPPDPGEQFPDGSFLWQIEPAPVCWTEWINTPETQARQIPALK